MTTTPEPHRTSAPGGMPPLREIEFSQTDALLRDDVRRLGTMVGEMLAEQASPAFLDQVESVRRMAIARREADEPIDALAQRLAQVPLDDADALVRAFAAYFDATNLAERVHRIRRRRDHQRIDDVPQPGGLEATLHDLRQAGVTLDELVAFLPKLSIQPVFTAHPTEVVRRALLEKEHAIVERLVADIDRGRTPPERRADEARIRLMLTSAWQTAEAAAQKPTVVDEVEHVGFYLANVLYRSLPVFYEGFADAIEAIYGQRIALPQVLRFGTWVGGDMDGNPNVGAETVRAALDAQRTQALVQYRRDLHALSRILTQSLNRIDVDAAVIDRIDAYRQQLPEVVAAFKPRLLDMPYRQLLDLMAAKLAATDAQHAHGYASADDFIADLQLIDASLVRHRGEHAGRFALQRVLWRARTFGLHLAALDLRQDSAVHEEALAVLLDDPDWASRPLAGQIARLHAVIEDGDAEQMAHVAAAREDPVVASTLAVFGVVREMRRTHGEHAIGLYIISMSRHVADALAVLALARIAGCVEGGASGEHAVPLDVAPLFETVADLEAAPGVMRALFDDPVYRVHLRARGDRQVVMLGYSDSAKDGGLMASRWALQRTQVELTALAQASGVCIVFFHGRGGSVSRGGGKTERAVAAAPRGSVNGNLRMTEQGEVIHRKYGIRALALRNLEQTTAAVLRASLRPRPADAREARWREIAAELAGIARIRYRALVYDDPRFDDYFRAATPIDVIERLHIGSRPSRRRDAGIRGLRAIPWVFAWAQNRSGLTAWYGVGHALRHGVATHGQEAMAEMARDWPFFRTMLDDLEMTLAKSDIDIFQRYSQLAGATHQELFPGIAEEFVQTRDAVLAIRGEDELLSGDPRLRLSIRLRNPYVDPISLLQVELLRRWREDGSKDDATLDALLATVNGIAAGIQNTG
ncbi:MAG: phosphoenolpyruvate carboxylase [Luteimonas sp.]